MAEIVNAVRVPCTKWVPKVEWKKRMLSFTLKCSVGSIEQLESKCSRFYTKTVGISGFLLP